ncbi:LysR family transcriptional regulator [Agathobacter sp.]
MTLLTYQVFKTVADIGSFHKAADILGLTPSAISHAITNMEKELGFTVLIRSKSGITLTSNGENLLPYVNAVLNSDESLHQMVADMNGLAMGTVKIGVFSSVCTSWLPDIMRSFNEKYKNVSIEVYQGTYDDVADWIKTGVVDLGFLSLSSAGDIPIEPLYRDPLICVLPKGMPKKDDTEYVDIDDMRDMQFVTQRESTDADIQNYLRENRLNIQSRYHVVDDLSTVRLVEKGFGICLMPELVMHDIPYDVDTYRLRPDASRIIGIAILNKDFVAPAVRTMYNHIVNNYQQDEFMK